VSWGSEKLIAVKKGQSPVLSEALADLEELLKKQHSRHCLPRASLFDSYVYNFSIKIENFRIIMTSKKVNPKYINNLSLFSF